MNVIAINGSPRKNWNTAQILKSALEGAREAGAETELVNLYDLAYTGCKSCFACKRVDGPSFARCALRDELRPVLEKSLSADVLLLGSPVYHSDITSGLHAYLERLWYPGFSCDKAATLQYHRRIPVKLFLTMNREDPALCQPLIDKIGETMNWMIGPMESTVIPDTLQYTEYSHFLTGRFDMEAKKRRHETVFPGECRAAFELGRRAVSEHADTPAP